MKKCLFISSVFLSLMFVLVIQSANAQSWELLGSRNVSDRVDHDRIMVTAVRGDFRRLKFTVARRPVEFYRVVVHYANGGIDRLELRQVIRAGGESRWVDLRGGDRVIRKIEFWYNARSLGGKSARVTVYGRG